MFPKRVSLFSPHGGCLSFVVVVVVDGEGGGQRGPPRQRSSRSSATWRCAALPFSRFRLLSSRRRRSKCGLIGLDTDCIFTRLLFLFLRARENNDRCSRSSARRFSNGCRQMPRTRRRRLARDAARSPWKMTMMWTERQKTTVLETPVIDEDERGTRSSVAYGIVDFKTRGKKRTLTLRSA